MKTLELETSKGRFLLVDMVIDIWTPEDEKSSTLYLEGETYQVMSCIKLSEITEEQASIIVDSNDEYGVVMYQNYQTTSMQYFDEQITAIESLHSLLKSKGVHLFKNPLKNTYSIQSLEGSLKHRNQIKDAEQKTFYNPYIFKL